jgi:hypothetical protein
MPDSRSNIGGPGRGSAPSWARWRDEPIVPSTYDDLVALVKLARRVRNHVVEFEWVFEEEDLRRLRSAVFHWSTGTRGRFKCFDARVLRAINDALGEEDTVFALEEPRGVADLEAAVSCERAGSAFRLRGHATFDVVFGYGTPGTAPDVRLGPVAAATLVEAVGQLGWDLSRFADPRLNPARNALFGLPLDYGVVVCMKTTSASAGGAGGRPRRSGHLMEVRDGSEEAGFWG